MADIADALATVREALEACDSDLKALAHTKGHASWDAINRQDQFRAAVRAIVGEGR